MSDKCMFCDGTGLADSGGIYPWGEPISIPCQCQTRNDMTVSQAIEALQNLGVSLKDYDSEALDIVLTYALAKLKDEQEPYKWPNP